MTSNSISRSDRGRICSVFIRFLWFRFFCLPDEEPLTPLSKPYLRGQCLKMRPFSKKLEIIT